MFTATHMVFHIFIIVFSVAGFSLAQYIRTKKVNSTPLICPVGANCDSVVRSEYAFFLGIPVELLGMGYYALTLVVNAVFLFFPAAMTVESMFLFLTATTVAFLFSLYLTAVQALVLREWCTWCLGSTFISALIFLASLAVSRFSLAELLIENVYVTELVQSLALAMGVGAATIAFLFYTKFLADLRVSTAESDVLHTIVEVLWIALAVVLLAGVGLYLPREVELSESMSSVIAALIATVFLSVINFVLYYLVAPRIVSISAGVGHEHTAGEMRRLRRGIFSLSALSIVSWYYVFVLRVLAPTGAGVGVLLVVYALALCATLLVSLVYERLQPR